VKTLVKISAKSGSQPMVRQWQEIYVRPVRWLPWLVRAVRIDAETEAPLEISVTYGPGFSR
jgi:hypothetical protein